MILIKQETIDVAIKERTMVNRRTVIEFFRSIQEHSIVKDKQRRKIKSHFSEVVQDPSIFRFEDDEGGFELWFPKRKRSLFPIVTRRLPTIHQANKYALLLTVVCGKSFPLRMEGDNKNTPSTNPGLEELGSNADSGVGIITPSTSTREEEYLGVKVKIKFRGKFYKTKVANGSTSPCWKETVAVPLDAIIEKVFDVSSSTFENEVVQVFVFDAIANDVRNVGGFYDDENTKLSENRYLVRIF